MSNIEKERIIFVFSNELEGLLGELVVTVGSLAFDVFPVDPQVVVVRVEHLLVVAPKVFRIVEVGEPLVVETEEVIEPLVVGAAGMTGAPDKAPFADHAGLVSRILQEHGDRDVLLF